MKGIGADTTASRPPVRFVEALPVTLGHEPRPAAGAAADGWPAAMMTPRTGTTCATETLMSPSPTERLNAIVEQGLCIGCGLCEALAPQSITVRKTTTGFEVPVVIGELDTTVDLIYDVCPGTRIEGLPDRLIADDTVVDAVWGPVRRIVRAWAGDPNVRHIGSTGGVLTALAQFLVASGRVEFVLHVKASATEPSFGEPTMSFTEAEVLAGAGPATDPPPRFAPSPTHLITTSRSPSLASRATSLPCATTPATTTEWTSSSATGSHRCAGLRRTGVHRRLHPQCRHRTRRRHGAALSRLRLPRPDPNRGR